MPDLIPQWVSDWAHTVTLFDFALWVGAAIGVVVFVRKGWPTVKKFAAALFKFVQIVDSVAGLPAFIDRTDATLHEQTATLEAQDVALTAQNVKIEEIHHEVNFNNGSSVKDAVIRVEASVQEVRVGVEGLYRVAAAGEMDDQARKELEDTRPPFNLPKE